MTTLAVEAERPALAVEPDAAWQDWLPCGAAYAEFDFPDGFELTDEFLREIGEARPELLFEVAPQGKLVVTMGAGGRSSHICAECVRLIGNWIVELGSGLVRESSGGYAILTAAGLWKRQPDVSWISEEKYRALTADQIRPDFWPVVPDFVIEVQSPSDRSSRQQEKMAEWSGLGVAVGWLIDPFAEEVRVYRGGVETERHARPGALEVGPELAGLTIDFARIWED